MERREATVKPELADDDDSLLSDYLDKIRAETTEPPNREQPKSKEPEQSATDKGEFLAIPALFMAAQQPQTVDAKAEKTEKPQPARSADEKIIELTVSAFLNVLQRTSSEVSAAKDKTIDIKALPSAEQDTIYQTQNVQEFIKLFFKDTKFKDLGFNSEEERQSFLKSLELECSIEGTNGTFKKLPEFGQATKDGYKRLVNLLGSQEIPDRLRQLHHLAVEPPAGLELVIAGPNETFAKSTDTLMAQLAQRGAFLKIDTSSLKDVSKLCQAIDWISDANKILSEKKENMLAGYLTDELNFALKHDDKSYHPGWARGSESDIDQKAWSRAFIRTRDLYQAASTMIEVLDHCRSLKNGFQSEGLKNLPEGIRLQRAADGSASGIDFGDLMVTNLKLDDIKNREKMQKIAEWINTYKEEAESAMTQLAKAKIDVVGCCEIPIEHGWVNKDTNKFIVSRDQKPEPWKHFNLLRYDVEITRNFEGKNLASVTLNSKCSFREVHPLGYLNSIYDEQHTVNNQQTYKPNTYVAVQTPSGKYEMVKAKDIEGWKLRQRGKMLIDDSITVGMDVLTIASGGVAVGTAKATGKAVAKELAKNAGKEFISTSYVLATQSAVARKELASGTAKIIIGGTGVIHNAGAEEHAPLSALSKARSIYFLSHASMNLFHTSAAKAAEAVKDGSRISYASSIERGGIEAMRAMSMPFKQVDWVARHGMFIADKAFIGMVGWNTVELYGRWGLKQSDLDITKLGDPKTSKFTAQKLAAQFTEYGASAFKDFAAALPKGSEASNAATEKLIAKAIGLSAPNANPDEKQKFMTQLMSKLHYNESQIGLLQKSFNSDQIEQLRSKGQGLNPRERHAAAAALLMLSRRPDGTYPATIVERTVNPPDFNDRTKTREVKQALTSNELLSLLEADFRKSSTSDQRLAKMPLLESLNVVSPFTAAGILLDRLESKDPNITEQQKIKALAQLGRILESAGLDKSNLKPGTQEFDDATAASFGLGQKDTLKRLTALAIAPTTAPKLRSTIDWVKDAIQTANRDSEYFSRLSSVFTKEIAGISPEQLLEQRRADLKVTGDTQAVLERRLLAASALLNGSPTPQDKADAIKALFAVAKSHQFNLSTRALEQLANSKDLTVNKAEVLQATLTLLDDMKNSRFTSMEDKNTAALERVRLIELGVSLHQDKGLHDRDSLIKGEFEEVLRSSIRVTAEPAEQAREAAIKGLQTLRIADQSMINSLAGKLDPTKEPAGSVRNAAVLALKDLCKDRQFLQSTLDKFVRSEPDWLVRKNLETHRVPNGNPKDASSEENKAKHVEDIKKANKPALDFATAREALKHAGLRWDDEVTRNLFDYFDWTKEKTIGFSGSTSFRGSYNASINEIGPGAFGRGSGFNLSMETLAQNFAFHAYDKKLDALVLKAKQSADGSSLAINCMFELLSGPSQMGKPFYQHNKNLNGPSAGEHKQHGEAIAFTPYTKNQQGHREQYARDENGKQTVPIQVFTEDPWSKVQTRLCKEIKAICMDQQNGVDKSHLVNLISNALTTRRENLSDDQRALLVESLDALCARKDIPGELKEEIIRFSAEQLRTMQPEKVKWQNAPELMERTQLALTHLLEKSIQNVRPGSDSYFAIRDSFRTRSSMTALESSTPNKVKLKVDEILDRQFYSLVSKFRTLPDQPSLKSERLSMLPRPEDTLIAADRLSTAAKAAEKKLALEGGRPASRDIAVDNAVHKILLAAKGGPISDPAWKESLLKLTDEKLDPRVRVAALYALKLTTAVQAEDIRNPLVDIFLDPKTHDATDPSARALRADVFALLSSLPNAPIHIAQIQPLKSAVLEKLGTLTGKPQEELAALDTQKLITLSRETIAQKLGADNLVSKTQAKELSQALHAYADGLTLIGSQNSKSGLRHSHEPPHELNKISLAQYGISLDRLKETFSRGRFDSENFEIYHNSTFDEIVTKLRTEGESSRDIPGTLRTINEYALSLINSGAPKEPKEQAEWMNTVIALNVVSKRLAASYYPDGSLELATHYSHIANAYKQLGKKAESILHAGETMWLMFGNDAVKMNQAAIEQYKRAAAAMNQPNKFDFSIKHQMETALDTDLTTLEKKKSPSRDHGETARLKQRLEEYPNKDSYEYASFMARKAGVDLKHAAPAQQPQALEIAKQWHLKALEKTAGIPAKKELHRAWLQRTEVLFDRFSPQTKYQDLTAKYGSTNAPAVGTPSMQPAGK